MLRHPAVDQLLQHLPPLHRIDRQQGLSGGSIQTGSEGITIPLVSIEAWTMEMETHRIQSSDTDGTAVDEVDTVATLVIDGCDGVGAGSPDQAVAGFPGFRGENSLPCRHGNSTLWPSLLRTGSSREIVGEGRTAVRPGELRHADGRGDDPAIDPVQRLSCGGRGIRVAAGSPAQDRRSPPILPDGGPPPLLSAYLRSRCTSNRSGVATAPSPPATVDRRIRLRHGDGIIVAGGG